MGIDDNDSLWSVVSALEYQGVYYEELPAKIAATSTEIVQGIAAAAEAEARRAQSSLAESVAEQARRLSLRINLETLLPLGVLALVCLLIYGSLLVWAGFCLGSSQAQVPSMILRMPSGLLMAGLLWIGGVFMCCQAAANFAADSAVWRKKMLLALALLVPGGMPAAFSF